MSLYRNPRTGTRSPTKTFPTGTPELRFRAYAINSLMWRSYIQNNYKCDLYCPDTIYYLCYSKGGTKQSSFSLRSDCRCVIHCRFKHDKKMGSHTTRLQLKNVLLHKRFGCPAFLSDNSKQLLIAVLLCAIPSPYHV